jgi:hypothetical protein
LTVRAAALLLTILVRPSSSLTLHQVLNSVAYQTHNFLKEHVCVPNNNNLNNCQTFFEKTEEKNPCALMMVLMHMHVEERALKSINNCQTFFEKTEENTPCALMMLLMHTHVEGRALSLLGHFVLWQLLSNAFFSNRLYFMDPLLLAEDFSLTSTQSLFSKFLVGEGLLLLKDGDQKVF